MIGSKKRNEIVVILLLAVICYFPIFLHLSSFPFRVWDESRLILSAYEMSKGGNLIVVHYDGSPDMWSTKPPLMIWLQAISIRLLGLNELSGRLPTGIAAGLTCALMFIFCFKYLKRIELGFISVLVLISSSGYIQEHFARTGDYDTLLALLTTTYLLCYFVFIETENRKHKSRFLLYFFIAVTLAVLCKGVQGLLFFPALLIYTLFRNKFFSLFKEKNLYRGIAVFLIFGVGYYFLREALNPGYLKAIWENELGGRYNTVVEGHEGPFSFYWDSLIERNFSAWYLLVPFGIIFGIAHKDKLIRNLTWFLTLAIAQYFLTLSSAETKIEWYEAPLFPLLAIVVGIFLSLLYNILRKQDLFISELKPSLTAAIVFLIMIFAKPYSQSINYVYNFKEISWAVWWYEIPYYLRHCIYDKVNIDGYKIVYNYWPSSIYLYQRMLDERNQQVTFCSVNDLKVGDTVVAAEIDFTSSIDHKFDSQQIDSYNSVRIRRLISLK